MNKGLRRKTIALITSVICITTILMGTSIGNAVQAASLAAEVQGTPIPRPMATSVATKAPNATPTPVITDLGGVEKGDVITVKSGNVKLKFKVVSLYDQTVRVESGKSKTPAVDVATSGNVKLPAKISCKGYTYTVVGIGKYAFYKCKSLTGITFNSEASVKTIRERAFQGCKALKKIVLPNTVTSIGKNAFLKCTALETVNYKNIAESNLANIKKAAFQGCTALQSFGIPNALKTIGEGAFGKCASLAEVYNASLEESALKTIGKSAFSECTALKRFVMPNSVETIGTMAFYGCSGLNKVVFNSQEVLKTLGEAAFYKCSSLKSIKLPKSLEAVSKGCFYGCSSLKTVTFVSDSIVNDIGEIAFYGCKKLKSVTLPGTVEKIRKFAFYGCEKLKTVVLEEGVKQIMDSAFGNCKKLISIDVPATVTKMANNSLSKTNKNLIVFCEEDSRAEKVAKKNKIDYEPINTPSIEAVILTADRINLPVGKEYTLKVSFEPEADVREYQKSLTWKMSAQGIVKLKKNKQSVVITGVKAGEVKLTVTTLNGKSASCTVVVK